MHRITPVVLLLLSSSWLVAQDQGNRPEFNVAVELVQIDVSVLDGTRQPVRGLTAADFTVFENGRPRPIRIFEAVDLPARSNPANKRGDAAWEAAAASAVATNQVGGQEGRLVFILMDRTIPTGEPMLAARKIATAAVEALGPGDLAAVVTTSGGMPQTLTANRARLIAALNRGDWATGISREQEEVIGKLDPLSDPRCLCGLCVLETVTNIANAVRNATRRNKVLLFIGGSVIVQAGPRPMAADVGCDRRVRDAQRTLFDSLALANLTVHSIDPGGLVSLGPQTSASSLGGKEGEDAPAIRLQKMKTEINDHLSNQGTLQVLPDLTGGRAILNTNAPETKVPEIFQESDAYYVIGFEPGAGGVRNEKRAIKVDVARTGVHVTTTRALVAPGPGISATPSRGAAAPSPLESSLSGLLPAARMPLDMAVAAFASPDGADAFVRMSVNATSFTESGATSIPFDVAVSATDQRGRPVASATQGSLVRLPPTRSSAAVVELQTHLTLKPGDYELRAAVMDRDRGVAASVFTQLAIPAFADAPLSLSDLVIGTQEITESPSDAAIPRIPIVPTTQRAFRPGDHVWAFLQVYEGTQKTADPIQPVSVRTTIVDEQGRTVYEQSVTLAQADFVNRRADHQIMMPLEQLSRGGYMLRIEATLAQRTALRAVPFAVR